jgi:hypothetical protein
MKYSTLIDDKEELLPVINAVLNQNYFQHNQNFCKHTQGLAMGAPTSPLFAKIYVQYLKHNCIYESIIDHKIIAYFRCVDDTLIIYNRNKTDMNKIIDEFNKLKPSLRFTKDLENKNKLTS